MLVVSVDMHNLNDSAAAILGSFSGCMAARRNVRR